MKMQHAKKGMKISREKRMLKDARDPMKKYARWESITEKQEYCHQLLLYCPPVPPAAY